MKNSYNRKNNERIWLFGKHVVISAIKNPARKIHKIIVSDKNMIESIESILPKGKNVNIILESLKYISSIASHSMVHQGCAIEVDYLEQPHIEDVMKKSNSCLLLLDQITDSYNIGSIIRSAAAFMVDAVITTNDNSPNENATLVKSSSGMFEIVPYIKVVNLKNCINTLKNNGYWCIGLDSNSNEYIDKISLPDKTAFILGSEDDGLRNLTKSNCDFVVKIPIHQSVDSLNVSNAASIALYEYRKKFNFDIV